MFNRDKKTKNTQQTDVVAALRKQVQDAKALSAIPDQKLLADPRLNPATRGQADELTAARLSEKLALEHKRELRRAREEDRREEREARRQAAIDAARDATDPATTVLDLTTSRKRYVTGALVASIVCSVGSAMGVEAYAQTMSAPTGLGYAAEVAMTGLSTYAIAWRGGLARGRAVLEGIPTWALPVLIVAPLLASIAASTAGSGPVGAVCSIGAAAFAWFAYLVSSTGADAIAQAVDRMDRQAATEDQGDEHVPAGPAPLPRRSDRRDALTVVGDALADEASEYLRGRDADRGDDTSSAAVVPPGDDGVTSDVPPSEEADDDAADQARPTPLRRPRKRPGESLEDAARRRAAEAERRVRGYFEAHPDAAVKEAARDLRMDPKTVRKYRPGAEGSAA